jgi:hypothetical protein
LQKRHWASPFFAGVFTIASSACQVNSNCLGGTKTIAVLSTVGGVISVVVGVIALIAAWLTK